MSTLSYHFPEFAIGAAATAPAVATLSAPPFPLSAGRATVLRATRLILSCAGIPSVPPPGRILSTPTQDRMRIVPNQTARFSTH